MSQRSTNEDDKIDLRELVAALWSHKILIALFTGLFFLLAGYHSLTAQKQFTALAIFKVEKLDNDNRFNSSGQLGALASIAGINGLDANSSSIKMLLERLQGREFIIKMKNKFSIERDTFFNQFNPNYKDPLWKSTIKKLVGWQKTELDNNALIENNVVKNYRANVLYNLTKAGAIELYVRHIDPQKASYYANSFMKEIRLLVEEESAASQALQLNYLSETLADALEDMDSAQENLKNYAFENSALAQENFISDSLKLDKIRMEKRKVKEIADLLNIIENFIKSGNLDSNSYEALRSSHPLVDDIDFRRILGMSETISSWSWPDVETISAVNATLKDRIRRLDVDIKNIEENAQIYATSAEDLANYQRDAKLAEATYTVLVEQVKSASLAAGFQPETFEVFQFATPPMAPSSPKRNLILALGATLGIFVGSALALVNSILRNVYYTRSALLFKIDADLSLKSKPIKRLARKSISEVLAQLSKREITELDKTDLQLANKKIIYVLNSKGQPTASNTARLLAMQSAKSGRNVVLCDTTGQTEKEIKEQPKAQNSMLHVTKVSDNINVTSGTIGSSFFTSKNFNSSIKDLAERFDQVFICATYQNSQVGLIALLKFSPALVMIAGLRKTRKSDIKEIKTRLAIDVLFYD